MIVCSLALLTACVDDDIDQLGRRAQDVGVEDRLQVHTTRVLFDGGTDGYHSYRIPSIVRSPNGTLLAFAEGRKDDNRDYGNINVVYKMSLDNGATWSGLKQVVGVGPGTWGNPTAVVDVRQNRVWLMMSWNAGDHNQHGTDGFLKISRWGDRRVFVSHSDNDGATWTTPEDLTATLLPANATWDAIGPGTGIQTQDGRLVIPAIGRNIYAESDTVARTVWKYALTPTGTSEATVVELLDGSLMRNDVGLSAPWDAAHRRFVARGTIERGFSTFAPDGALLDPRCEGSIFRYTPGRILFLNPSSTVERCRMGLRISYDDGHSWPIRRSVYDTVSADAACAAGKGGYSSITKTADNEIGMLIETNEAPGASTSHRSIEFHKANLPWLLDGTPEP